MAGPVIAICGAPGAGKSRLTEGLAARLKAAPVPYDAFETFTRRGPDAALDWIARDAPYGEIRTPGLAEALRVAVAAGPVIFDTPLGRAHPETGPMIGRAVWIDCPLDLALARKVAQLAGDVPPPQAGDFVGWLRSYLAQYEHIVRPACEIQLARVRPLCEVIVDARDPVEKILDNLAGQCGTS